MKHIRRSLSLLLAMVMLLTSLGLGLTANALGDLSPQANVTLTFKPNGDGVTNLPDNITVSSGTTITIPPKTGDTPPTRDGYKFMGWAYSSATTQPSTALTPGTTMKLTGNITAYAVWQKTYTLTYNANGGTDAPAAVKDYGEITVTSAEPKRSGYTFIGWGQTAGATAAWKTAGDKYDLKADVTFYAVWKQYTLTFDANGGSGGPGTLKGGTVKIPDTEPTRTGYAFLGWAATASATTANTAYAKGKEVSLKADLKIYAVWKKAPTLTFDVNGGYGSLDPISGNTVTIPERGNSFGRTSYDFIGWANSKTATKADYQPLETIDLTGDKTVYAVWRAESETTKVLSFSANGGSYTESPDQIFKAKGSQVTIPNVTPTREGYTFLGWNVRHGTFYEFADIYPGETYTIKGYGYSLDELDTLYAVWAPSGSTVRTMTYDANGGTGGGLVQKAYGYITVPDYFCKRSGYTQKGWNSKADGTGTTYVAGQSFKPTSNRTFYAKWEQYTLTYDANGGTGAPASQTGGTVTISSVQPTREGYIFLGWGARAESTEANSNYAPGKSLELTKNTTIYAVWQKMYTLTFDANGGSGAPNPITGAVVTMPGESSLLYRTGYQFIGWADTKTATTGKYQPMETLELTADKTVYAVWYSKEATNKALTYSANGGDYSLSPDQTFQPNGDITLSSATPTRTGYTFLGWATQPNHQYAAYAPGTTYRLADYENRYTTILYAVWAPDGTPIRTVNFSANGGTGAPQARRGYGSIQMPGYVCTRPGYTQKGWNTRADGTGTTYLSGEGIKVNVDSVTIYAKWEQYTLTYDANGGTGAPASQTGGTVTISSVQPTREGYTFLGWGARAESTEANSNYAPGKSLELTKNTTIYAVWQKNPDLPGDLNGDGDLDEADATLILRYAAGLATLTDEQLAAADLNHDGDVDEADATIILRYAAGLITELP